MLYARARRAGLRLLGLAGMRGEDILLSSYPRSGNTWLRFFLCNLISLLEWDGRTIDFTLLNQTMPGFGTRNLLKPWPHSAIPRVITTHKRYFPLFGRCRSIGIIRDPRDVMVSYYYYKKFREGNYVGTFAEFIRNRRLGLESWLRHYGSWHDHWTLILRYENMKEDPFCEFSRVLAFLGVSYSEDIVREAISRSSVKNVRKADNLPKAFERREAMHARSGHTQQWVTHFDARDLAYFYELAESFGVDVCTEAKH